ncbi:EAF6 Chromatin modification-related protein EAF6 [Candida maltosa Xu316]
MSGKPVKESKNSPTKSKDGNLATDANKKDESAKEPSSSSTSTSTSKNESSTKTSVNTEKYDELRNKLIQHILKKQELSKKLTALEDSIYQKEIDYFEESPLGNIIKGFENISKTTGTSSSKRRVVFTEDDHIFSLSSVNYARSLLKRQGHTTNGTKEDYDDFEDSVDPNTANLGVKPPSGIERAETPTTGGGTPSRKRKARTFDD